MDPLPLRYGDWYLESYARTRVHQEMISDKVRTEAYREAIQMSRHLIKDKVIMDVGCGTGILSLFAAKAGAKRVIAVESSDMADCAEQVMKDNKMDHIITVIKGRLEDIQTLPHGITKVDVIISEFMGYSLFFEGMLDTVIFARDKWLKPGGAILPDKGSLYIFGVTDGDFKIKRVDYWNDVRVEDDSYDFSVLASTAVRKVWKHKVCDKKNVITNYYKLLDIDLNTITCPDLRIMRCDFTLTAKKSLTSFMCHGVGTYFTVTFSKCHVPITLSTAPWQPTTHWVQCIFYFKKDVDMLPETKLSGYFALRKHPRYHRDIQFSIQVRYAGFNEEFEERNIYLSI